MGKGRVFAIAALITALVGTASPAFATPPTSVAVARANVERLMSALAHNDYAEFIKNGTIEFRRLGKEKFEQATLYGGRAPAFAVAVYLEIPRDRTCALVPQPYF